MFRSFHTKASLLALLAGAYVSAACLSVQDFGGDAPPAATDDEGGAPGDDGGLVNDSSPTSVGTWQWQWVNPSPTGRALYGIGGASDTDIWVAGEGGTVAHWNGLAWDVLHTGPDTTRWFSIGVHKANDVWVAGDANGKIDIVHYDGKDWIDSYPFSGSAFNGFSHGPGSRLFAFVDTEIFELTSAGTWVATDVSADDVFGAPADIWVNASGEAWAILIGARVMHLPAGSQKWDLVAPIAGVPPNVAGLSISGSGTKLCAFYTSRSGGGTGYLTYDGLWRVAPSSTDPLPVDTTHHGSQSACFPDGTGLLIYDDAIVLADPFTAPAAHNPFDFQGEKLYGAWSVGGAKAYTVGAIGAFLSHGADVIGAIEGTEVTPTVRHDILTVDVGADGTVIAADSIEPNKDPSSGGEVLFWKSGLLAPYTGTGFLPPSIPVGVAVISKDDAWVLANDNSLVSVAHYKNGAWGVDRTLSNNGTPLAIWAPAKDDVWATADAQIWHYDGSAWNTVATTATYRSIHGSASDDVWFAGEGVAHWDGKKLTPVPSLKGSYTGVWASAKGRTWLWGDTAAVLYDGKTTTPVEKALGAAAEWTTAGIAEASTGDVFVLTKQATGTALLWFDPSHSKLVEQISSDLELWGIRGHGNELWAFGVGGASLRFGPPSLH